MVASVCVCVFVSVFVSACCVYFNYVPPESATKNLPSHFRNGPQWSTAEDHPCNTWVTLPILTIKEEGTLKTLASPTHLRRCFWAAIAQGGLCWVARVPPVRDCQSHRPTEKALPFNSAAFEEVAAHGGLRRTRSLAFARFFKLKKLSQLAVDGLLKLPGARLFT